MFRALRARIWIRALGAQGIGRKKNSAVFGGKRRGKISLNPGDGRAQVFGHKIYALQLANCYDCGQFGQANLMLQLLCHWHWFSVGVFGFGQLSPGFSAYACLCRTELNTGAQWPG